VLVPPQSAPINTDASTWVTDTGASNHITNDLANLTFHDSYRGADKVVVGNVVDLPISHIGSSTFSHNSFTFKLGLPISHISSSTFSHNSSAFKLSNILCCPNVFTNLLSVHQFTRDNNCFFVFFHDFFYIKYLKTGKTLFLGPSNDGLYFMNIHYQISTAKSHPFAFLGARVAAQVWHSRLGHLALAIVSKLLSNKFLPTTGFCCLLFCHSCPLGKISKLSFQLSNSASNNPLNLIHSDVWSSPIASMRGFKYYVLFVDDYSRYSWIFPMHYKSEVFDIFVKFKTPVENMFSSKIKALQSNGGEEYTILFNNFLPLMASNIALHVYLIPNKMV